MAEILGISAAVVQFIDIAFRLSSGLGNLYKDLRDVPAELQDLKLDIDQQIAIAEYIRSSHAVFWNTSPTGSAMPCPVDGTLASYMLLMEQLLELLQSIANKDDAGTVRRSWNAVRAVHKRKSVLEVCDSLEKKKSSVILWLSNANLQLSVTMRDIVEGLQTDVRQTMQITRKVEEASYRADQQLSHLPSLKNLSNSTASAIASLASDMSSSQKQILISTDNTNVQLRSLQSQWEELSPTFHQFRDILERCPHLLNSAHQVGSGNEIRTTHSGDDHALSNGVISHSRQPFYDNKTRASRSCTCRVISRTTVGDPFPFLQFRQIFRRHHYRQCPKFNSAGTDLEFLMRIVPPTWLMRHTINLGVSLQYWGSGNSRWRMAPLIVGTSRLVDSKTSPAFQAIRRLHPGSILPGDIRALSRSLKDLFASGQASVYDEDDTGHTLLHDILYRYRYCGYEEYATAIEFLSLIRWMLENGADPNAYREARTESPFMKYKESGTVLDIFASDLICKLPPTLPPGEPKDLLREVYAHLIESGAHFSRSPTLPHYQHYQTASSFDLEVKEFLAFEEKLEVCEINDLIVSILRQDRESFLRALTQSNLNQYSGVNRLIPVNFAIYWPSALEELIAAGVDVNCEDSLGRGPIQLAIGCGQAPAADILLRADCSLYTPKGSKTLLQEGLLQGRDFDYVTEWIIDALIDRHTRLIDLAILVLPDDSELKRGLDRFTILEDRAPELFEALTKSGVPVPPSLKLNGDSVYHTVDHWFTAQLTVPLADRLWQGGFKQVNKFTSHAGISPLLQSWFMADFDMVSWFIGKGVSPFSRDRERSLTGLHFFAARLAYPLDHFGYDGESTPISPTHIKQLADDKTLWHDSCHCLCSVDGCTPISTLVSHSWNNRIKYVEETYQNVAKFLKIWREKMMYRPDIYPEHARQLLRAVLFEMMQLRHTCLQIETRGEAANWVVRQRSTWTDPWVVVGGERHDYTTGELKAEFELRLEKGYTKMDDCRCDVLYKPICALFRDECPAERDGCH
ncbi:hypothetical protein F5X98DRAFT_359939 [Xylaria grammica]|nr:hypothetical protein F5X98DRAFT_359939 [Xylaria grammica]